MGAGGSCPTTPRSTINFNGPLSAHGRGPFYFGPYTAAPGTSGGLWSDGQLTASDFNKTPWSVDVRYTGRLLVRGQRLDGQGQVAFGFWPRGFGTPAEQIGVPVAFDRLDQAGRRVVYQPELDIDIRPNGPAEWRLGGGFWSLPERGCYAIQADGDGFKKVTVIQVTKSGY
jgi:hypothetical protein